MGEDTTGAGRTLSRRELFTLFGALMLTMLLASLDQTIVGTALPTIVGGLEGMENYTWVVTAYLIATTASTPLYGAVAPLSPEQARRFGEADVSGVMESPTVVQHLPEPVKEAVQQAFTDGLDMVFTVAAVIAAVSIVMTLCLPNLELRGAMPVDFPDNPDAKAAEIKTEVSP